MVEDSRRDTVNTEPSAVAPDAIVNFGIKPLARPIAKVDSSIRRYRARFCIGGRLFPQFGLWHPIFGRGSVIAQSVPPTPNCTTTALYGSLCPTRSRLIRWRC